MDDYAVISNSERTLVYSDTSSNCERQPNVFYLIIFNFEHGNCIAAVQLHLHI